MRAKVVAPLDTLRRTLLLRMAEAFGTLAKQRGHTIREGNTCPHLFIDISIFKQQKRARLSELQNEEATSPLRQFS
jgi:hypothetical protein